MTFKHSFAAAIASLVIVSLISCTDDDDRGSGPAPVQLSATLTAPLDGAGVTDFVDIKVDAVDDKGIAKVEFYFNANKIGEDAVAPYELLFNSNGLVHGSVHSIFAIAFDTDGNSFGTAPITCTIDTTLALPQQSTIFPPTSITDSSLTLTWTQNTDNDFEKYVVTWDTSATPPFHLGRVSIPESSDTVLDITSLRDNITYHFQLTSHDVFGRTTSSATVSAQIPNAPPPRPTIINIFRNSSTLTVNWSRSTIVDFAKYEIVFSRDSILDVADSVLATIVDIDIDALTMAFADTGVVTIFLVVHDTSMLSTSSAGFRSDPNSTNFALQFDGSKYATIPFFPALNVGNIYTLEAWINMESAATYMRVIDKSPESSPWLQYSLICDPSPGADVCNGGSPARFHSGATIPLNEWHHIALTYDNGVIIYYVDGAIADTTLSGINQTCGFSTTLNIGRRKMFNEFYFNGMIDDVRVWNTVRTPTQINTNFNTRLSGAELGLVCNFNFDEGIGDIINSPVGGNGHLGEVSGPDSKDPVWVTSTAPISN